MKRCTRSLFKIHNTIRGYACISAFEKALHISINPILKVRHRPYFCNAFWESVQRAVSYIHATSVLSWFPI
jgi:hypothetical protein